MTPCDTPQDTDRDGLVEKAADRLYDVLSAQLEEERDAAGESSVHESTWRVIGALREAGWLRERPPAALDHWRDRAIAAEGRLSEDRLRERPPLAEYQRGYRDGHWEGMQECGRPPLTEERLAAAMRKAWQGTDGNLDYSDHAREVLAALASSTTEERDRG